MFFWSLGFLGSSVELLTFSKIQIRNFSIIREVTRQKELWLDRAWPGQFITDNDFRVRKKNLFCSISQTKKNISFRTLCCFDSLWWLLEKLVTESLLWKAYDVPCYTLRLTCRFNKTKQVYIKFVRVKRAKRLECRQKISRQPSITEGAHTRLWKEFQPKCRNCNYIWSTTLYAGFNGAKMPYE